MSRWRRLAPADRGALLGLLAGAAVSLWLTIVLLTGPGATVRVLLVPLLFVLPVLGCGALVGWIGGAIAGRLLGRSAGAAGTRRL